MAKFNKLDLNTFHWKDIAEAKFEGKYDMPILQPVSPSELGVERGEIKLVAFHSAMIEKEPKDKVYHFYEDDYQFERFWKSPSKYIPKLRQFRFGISPDYSVYLDMPRSQQIWNCWRNRVSAYNMQRKGLRIVPNVSWSDYESLEWALNGIPEHSALGVTTQGCMGYDYVCKQALLNGLHELVIQKYPELLLIYGSFPEQWKERFPIPILTLKTFSQEKWGGCNG